MPLILLNALQAGNRSGTGRYATALARWLPVLSKDLEFAVLWPRSMGEPAFHARHHALFIPCDAKHPLKRLYIDQIGIRSHCAHLGTTLVHYPATIGSISGFRKTVVTVHDLSFFRHPEWFRLGHAFYYRRAVRRGIMSAERVIVDSKATGEDVHEFLRVPWNSIDVVPLGVDEAYRPPAKEAVAAMRAKYGLPGGFFLYLGTLEPRKNLSRLIDAWSIASEGCDQHLVIAGREGWKVEAVEQAIRRSSASKRIHRIGYVAEADVPALMGSAYAFVWPSLWEGFGLPPLEAMACGVPVLTSNTSSLPEVAGDAALMVDPYDVHAIAGGIRTLAEDKSTYDKLKSAGRARAADFTWRRTAEEVLDVYRKAIDM